MLSNCIKDLLNLKEFIVKKVKNSKNYVEIYAEQICPHCGCSTSKIHDHYVQPIKDIPIQFKPTTIFLKKTRYECKNCGKSFYPHCDFIAKYSRKSKRLISFTVEQLRNNVYLVYFVLMNLKVTMPNINIINTLQVFHPQLLT